MLIDLHVHSHLSKGCELNPRLVLERAALFGLDGVAFTETNTQDGFEELLELNGRTGVKIFIGLELLTDRGQYLCFFPRPELAPEPVQMWGSNREKPWNAAECLAKLKSLGAAVIAARPYDRESPYPAGDFILTVQGLNAVEGYNPKVRQTANELALEAAESLKLPCVGGSDARGSLDEVGRAATLFKNPIRSQADLVSALVAGQCWAVMMGELPKLTRPGEAREAENRKEGGRRRRKGARGGRSGSWN
jgi:predicted metal-dependent phosphoesterase TrpH